MADQGSSDGGSSVWDWISKAWNMPDACPAPVFESTKDQEAENKNLGGFKPLDQKPDKPAEPTKVPDPVNVGLEEHFKLKPDISADPSDPATSADPRIPEASEQKPSGDLKSWLSSKPSLGSEVDKVGKQLQNSGVMQNHEPER